MGISYAPIPPPPTLVNAEPLQNNYVGVKLTWNSDYTHPEFIAGTVVKWRVSNTSEWIGEQFTVYPTAHLTKNSGLMADATYDFIVQSQDLMGRLSPPSNALTFITCEAQKGKNSDKCL